MIQPDLSVVVTAHDEGILLHKTVRSLQRALTQLDGEFTYEVILHLDSPSPETIDYVQRYRPTVLRNYTIIQNSFHDPSLSRNMAVAHSNARWVAVIDGDDLVTRNYFICALSLLSTSSQYLVVHPQFVVSFGTIKNIMQQYSSSGRAADTLRMVYGNLWSVACVAPREVFLEHPYQPNTSAFGYEDKLFNCDTLADEISHVVVQTALFYRRKSKSVLTEHGDLCSVIRPSPYFDYDVLKTPPLVDQIQSLIRDQGDHPRSHSDQSSCSGLFHRVAGLCSRLVIEHHRANIRASKTYERWYIALKHRIRMKLPLYHNKPQATHGQAQYPHWLISEMYEVHLLDAQVYPDNDLIYNLPPFTYNYRLDPGRAFIQITNGTKQRPDTMFLVGYASQGEANKVLTNCANELSRRKEGHICVMQTQVDTQGACTEGLDSEISFVDFARVSADLPSYEEKLAVLAHFLVQHRIERIIIWNSQLGYDFVARYRSLIRESKISVDILTSETLSDNRQMGYCQEQLPAIYDVVHKIITDNHAVVQELVDEFGFDPDRFVTRPRFGS